MNFMSKRRRLKFQVNCTLDSLRSVPFVSGVLFAKLRLCDGGTFAECSSREEVKNHMVQWNKEYSFACKFVASQSSGVLESRHLRISVRKELKGGRTYEKLGYVDLDLAEFAGQGCTRRRYLLEGYDTKHRQDNSILEVVVTMTLLSGDPLFKVPRPPSALPFTMDPESAVHAEEARAPDISVSSAVPDVAPLGVADYEASSLASNSSGFSSLSKKQKANAAEAGGHGHSRNSSYNSEMSNYGSYGRGAHGVRHAPAAGAGLAAGGGPGSNGTTDNGHMRSASSGSNRIMQSARRLESERTERIDSTRVDADELVQELLDEMKLTAEPRAASGSGLQLYVGVDGSASIGAAKRSGEKLTQVVLRPQ